MSSYVQKNYSKTISNDNDARNKFADVNEKENIFGFIVHLLQ